MREENLTRKFAVNYILYSHDAKYGYGLNSYIAPRTLRLLASDNEVAVEMFSLYVTWWSIMI